MPPPNTPSRASFLLVEECFAREDAGFLDALRQFEVPQVLAAFADRWKADVRPWARMQLLDYLNYPLDCPGHQPLVKRLFKHAEARKDDELVAAFLVAFDVSIRRKRKQQWRWNRDTRSATIEERLVTPRDVIPRDVRSSTKDSKSGQRVVVSTKGYRVRAGRIFTHRTRHYLRRRAWRYFRWLGYSRPADFPRVVVPALRRYHDAHLAVGENILDSWVLLNVCYRDCAALEFHSVHIRLKEGHTLAELRATPRFPASWSTPEAALLLLGLVAQAPAQLVRMWAMELFRSVRPTLELDLPAEALLGLLDHADERVQQFGAELFAAHPGLDKLPLATWLRLLGTGNLGALAIVTDAFAKHVSSERLTLEQCLQLACAKPVPVARLGQRLLVGRTLGPGDYPVLAGLASARCPAVAGELATWALALVGARERYDVGTVCRFFDSLSEETRAAAWTWLLSGSVGYDDPVLWSRLAETPFDDLRLKLIDHLALRVKTPRLSADQLSPVWCAVLLGVHRGGRQKLKAVREIAEAIARTPASAAQLLPIMSVAVRSVRGPEMRAGLAAVMILLNQRPELAAAVRALLPELKFELGEVAA